MNTLKKFIKKIKSPVWVGFFVLLFAIIIIIFSSRILYIRTVDLLTENLRERILTISITAATNINANDLSALHVEEDWQKPEWATVVNSLNKAKYSNDDIVFMYIFRKTKNDPTQMEFVADADSINPYANTSGDILKYIDVNRDGKVEADGPDKLQWPGQPYPEAIDIPEVFEAYNGPLTSKDLYTDEYGTVITGYAPIKDENGNTVAILATDIKADDFFTITTQTLSPFIVFIIFLTLIISILTILVIYVWRRYAKFLEKSNADQANLMHIMNHQIKGRLGNSKNIFAELMTDDYGVIPESARFLLEKGLEETNAGVNYVQTILKGMSAETGKLPYTMVQINLKEIISEITAKQKEVASKKGLTFDVDIKEGNYSINGDALQLTEAIRNIIDNSINYTQTGGIKFFLEQQKYKIIIAVKDTGVGLSHEDKTKLFKAGGRGVNSIKVNINSTGYGLAFVKGVIEAHGGRVWAESEGTDKGAQFYIEFPIKPTANIR